MRRASGPPSTQFAPTIVAMPDALPAGDFDGGADAPNPDTLSPDSLAIFDGSSGNGAVPDVVTDIGGLPSEVPDPADAPTLSHIGRYALKHALGSGGLGTVFEAWDPLLSRAVAVKTLQLDADPQSRTALDGLFLNEARAAAGLNHRYIVTIHDAGLSPHGVYIAMERLYGRDLQRALADGWKPGVEQTVQLVRRVNEALAFAHARGVVHCDIKPANIFLQRRDRPKVLDFGIARILHGRALPALAGAVVGSPRYRAPEQLNGGTIDARADLFSLGVVMYEMLTGRRAFPGDTLDEINHAVLHTDPPPAHEVDAKVPRELSAVVARLMARSPADRYTCASELNADLRRWIIDHGASQGAAASAVRPLPTVAAPLRPRRGLSNWLMGGAAALGLAAAGLVAWGPVVRASDPSATALPFEHTVATQSGAPVLASTLPRDDAEPAPPPNRPEAAASAVQAVPASPPAAAVSIAVAPAPTARPRTAIEAPPRTRPVLAEPAARELRPAEEPRAQAPAAEPALGQVQLAVSPWAEVEVNGTPLGTTPPLNRLTLPEGTHQVTLRNADFAPHTLQIQVSSDRPVMLRYRFGS